MELKPCPVCKKGARETNFYVKSLDDSRERWYVQCLWCGYHGPESALSPHDKAEKKAIELWNALDRTDYKVLAQELATVVKMVKVGTGKVAVIINARDASGGREMNKTWRRMEPQPKLDGMSEYVFFVKDYEGDPVGIFFKPTNGATSTDVVDGKRYRLVMYVEEEA